MVLHTRILIAFCLANISGCSLLKNRPAPGADQVRVTKLAADVRGCNPVGNLRIPKEDIALFGSQLIQLKNQTIGFGGNVALVTNGTPRYPELGIAYQCPTQK